MHNLSTKLLHLSLIVCSSVIMFTSLPLSASQLFPFDVTHLSRIPGVSSQFTDQHLFSYPEVISEIVRSKNNYCLNCPILMIVGKAVRRSSGFLCLIEPLKSDFIVAPYNYSNVMVAVL